jgi:hypothetical protein
MSVWDEQDVEHKVVAVLRDVPLTNEHHAFGRPFMTAYQLAIALDARFPEVRQVLGYPLGGSGVEERNSLAQYLATQLSDRIRDSDGAYPVQGGFVSSVNVLDIRYRSHDGSEIVSSLTGTGYDLSMFRLANP